MVCEYHTLTVNNNNLYLHNILPVTVEIHGISFFVFFLLFFFYSVASCCVAEKDKSIFEYLVNIVKFHCCKTFENLDG